MKGTVADLMGIVVVVLILSLTIIIAGKVIGEISTEWDEIAPDTVSKEIMEQGKATINTFDYLFLFAFMGLGLASVIGASLIDTHPIFFVFSILLLVIIIFVGAQITNVFNEVITTTEMAAIANSFPIMVGLMRNLPLIMLMFGSLISIVLYGKIREG